MTYCPPHPWPKTSGEPVWRRGDRPMMDRETPPGPPGATRMLAGEVGPPPLPPPASPPPAWLLQLPPPPPPILPSKRSGREEQTSLDEGQPPGAKRARLTPPTMTRCACLCRLAIGVPTRTWMECDRLMEPGDGAGKTDEPWACMICDVRVCNECIQVDDDAAWELNVLKWICCACNRHWY